MRWVASLLVLLSLRDTVLGQVFELAAPQVARTAHPIRLASAGRDPRYLGLGATGQLSVLRADLAATDWTLMPVGQSLVRLQTRSGNQWRALGCRAGVRQTVQLLPVSGDAGQLWRILPQGGSGGGYAFENVLYPGQVLSWSSSGVSLQALSFATNQIWMPSLLPSFAYDPIYRTVSHRYVPNPPLPPAQVDLLNRHSNALWVLVADRRAGGYQKYRIPPGASERVLLDRDGGGQIVENYEVQTASGLWETQEWVNPIPPAMFYDFSVYEEFLQSISIDRTGKSPNPIEDINYQPKSIGWFLIPPGNTLPDVVQMDVLAQAKAANNPGAVRRVDPKMLEKEPLSDDPLKALLQEIQGQRVRL